MVAVVCWVNWVSLVASAKWGRLQPPATLALLEAASAVYSMTATCGLCARCFLPRRFMKYHHYHEITRIKKTAACDLPG
jgi:hypothetical protein